MEGITFSLNIRPRTTTKSSAFELMNSCRKPRLPIEAEILASLYPDLEDLINDEWGRDDDVEELVDYIETTQMTCSTNSWTRLNTF